MSAAAVGALVVLVLVTPTVLSFGLLRGIVDDQLSQALRGEASVDDWAMIGDRDSVREQLKHYTRALGMTHLIAVRPRIRGVQEAWHRESLQALKTVWDELAAETR